MSPVEELLPQEVEEVEEVEEVVQLLRVPVQELLPQVDPIHNSSNHVDASIGLVQQC